MTHIKVVPALLIRLINSPAIGAARPIRRQGHPERRAADAARGAPEDPAAHPERVRAGEFRDVGRDAVVRAPRRPRGGASSRPAAGRSARTTRCASVDDEGREVPPGEVGELTCRGPYTLRGYYGVPEYNARQFTPDGFYRSGDLMRLHPSGNYIVEGRKKDLINRGGGEDQRRGDREPDPAASGGAERGLRADARPGSGRADVRLRDPAAGRRPVAPGPGRVPDAARRSRSSSCRSGSRSWTSSRSRRSARCRRRPSWKWRRKKQPTRRPRRLRDDAPRAKNSQVLILRWPRSAALEAWRQVRRSVRPSFEAHRFAVSTSG